MLDIFSNMGKIDKINTSILPVLNTYTFAYISYLHYSLINCFLLVFSIALLALTINYWSMSSLLFKRKVRQDPSTIEKDIQHVIKLLAEKTPIYLILGLHLILSLFALLFAIYYPKTLIILVILLIYLYLFFYVLTRFLLYSVFGKFFQ